MNPNFYYLSFFITGAGINASDFQKSIQRCRINLNYVVSLSDLKEFHLPLTGNKVGDFAIVELHNGQCHYIKKDEYERLSETLDKLTINV